MNESLKELRTITIHALWRGFATPPMTSNRLLISRDSHKGFVAHDEINEEYFTVSGAIVQDLLESLLVDCEEPDAKTLGRSDEEVQWHFGGCTTDDYPQVRVEICFENQQIVLESTSNHVHLLPWTIHAAEEVKSFNPAISKSLALMMPAEFLFRERLLTGENVWQAESEMRAAIRRQDEEETPSAGELSYEESRAKVDDLLQDLLDQMSNGEEVEFQGSSREYTANQLRRLSLDELNQLRADGFDLSTSDETGQTALMLSAFPPFHVEQFEKLVAAGADVNAKRTDGLTGLMLAAAGHMVDGVAHWIAAGADVNLRGPDGCTSLMLGARCRPIVAALLDAGAEAGLVDSDGDSAIDYAMQDISILRAKSRLDALELLIQRVSSKHPEMVEHSLENARNMARKVRVETSILYSLNQQPMSKNVADVRMKVGDRPSEHYLKDLADCIDLEITEIELADRIVAIIENGLETKNQ